MIPTTATRTPPEGPRLLLRDLALYALAIWGPFTSPTRWIVLPFLVPRSALVISGLFTVAHDAAHAPHVWSERLASIVGHRMLPWLAMSTRVEAWHNRVHHHYTVRQDF